MCYLCTLFLSTIKTLIIDVSISERTRLITTTPRKNVSFDRVEGAKNDRRYIYILGRKDKNEIKRRCNVYEDEEFNWYRLINFMDSHNPPSYLFMPRNTNTLVPRVNFILRFVFSRFSYSDFRDEFLDPIGVNKETRSPTVSGFIRECISRRKSIESFPLLDIDIRHYVPSSAKPLLSSKYFDCSWARCNFLPASFLSLPHEIQSFHFEDPSFSRWKILS